MLRSALGWVTGSSDSAGSPQPTSNPLQTTETPPGNPIPTPGANDIPGDGPPPYRPTTVNLVRDLVQNWERRPNEIDGVIHGLFSAQQEFELNYAVDLITLAASHSALLRRAVGIMKNLADQRRVFQVLSQAFIGLGAEVSMDTRRYLVAAVEASRPRESGPPAPLTLVDADPLQVGYRNSERHTSNQRAPNQVVALNLAPSQVAAFRRLNRSGSTNILPDDVPAARERQALGTGWEVVLQYRTSRTLPAGVAPTRAQMETIRFLNLDLGSSETEERPNTSKNLCVCAKIIYFRNMDVTDEDFSCLTSDVALGSFKEKAYRKTLNSCKSQCQRNAWGGEYFLTFVQKAFAGPGGTTYDDYRRMTIEQRQAFWGPRITLEVVKKLFRYLEPVNFDQA
jgi:hypothetical protein